MGRVIESDIPGSVKSMEYVRNCHYLTLKDPDGAKTTLVEKGLIRYLCVDCDYEFYSEPNRASHCPSCGRAELSQQWVRPQLSLVPEKATDFPMLCCVNEKPQESDDGGD